MTSWEIPSPAPVLVTGAASGIGLACARRLALAGHPVALADRDEAGLAGAVESLRANAKASVSGHPADLTDAAAAADAVAQAVRAHGDLSGVVNAAGAVRAGNAVDTTDEDWRWNLDTNVSSAFYVCRAALPHMVSRGGGAVVNIASLTALRPIPARSGYAAAKGAVIAYTRQLAFEYGPRGVTANVVCPGAVMTPLLRARFDAEPAAEQELVARIPLRRMGDPQELASLVHLLVSGGCGYLTGQTLVVDGGLSLV